MATMAASGAWIEGIGNEVLAACGACTAAMILCLAWYSTHLTQNQIRMTSLRIRRRGVTLNRLPGSSTADLQDNASRGNLSGRSSEQPDRQHPPTVDPDETNHVEPDHIGSDNMQLNQSSSENAELNSMAPEEPTRVETAPSVPTRPEAATSELDSNVPLIDASHIRTLVPDNDEATDESSEQMQESDTTSQSEECMNDEPSHDSNQCTDDSDQPSANGDRIRLKLKFLSETERIVTAKKTDTIEDIKRVNFAEELSDNKLIRLIYNGQELRNPRTLGSYNIEDNTVIHTLVSEPNVTTPPPSRSATDVATFNAGNLMVPLFVIILSLIWYLRIEYGQFFTLTSTISLICISIVFALGLMAQRMPTRNATRPRSRTYGINVNGRTTAGNS